MTQPAIEITLQQIESLSPNPSATKNGLGLYQKKMFSALSKSEDGTLYFGNCAGSGKTPYFCSADFIDENQPVFRCNCPSRQFPCKHAIGLLFTMLNKETFNIAEVPSEIEGKRKKIEKQKEKKKESQQSAINHSTTALSDTDDSATNLSAADLSTTATSKPKKVNSKALLKKIESQLEGIALAKRILNHILLSGLASFDKKAINELTQQIKALGNYYITGVENAFNELVIRLDNRVKDDFTDVTLQLNYLAALLDKAETYLNEKLNTPPHTPNIDSSIEEQIGYVWKINELIEFGLFEQNASLVQFAFWVHTNDARKEWIDEGYWLNCNTGKIYKTRQYRPFKAKKYINAADSVIGVMDIPLLSIYPGEINPRVRWDEAQQNPLNESVYQAFQHYAERDFSQVIKSVKNAIKSPLNDKNPIYLLKPTKAFKQDTRIILEDENQYAITLDNIDYFKHAESNHDSMLLLSMVLSEDTSNLTIAVMFEPDLKTGLLYAKPLAITTEDKIIRLLY